MEITKFFESTDIELKNNEIKASRKQIQGLYKAPKRTLADTINKLKQDGLVVGEISPTANNQAVGAAMKIETFNLDETISIGFRLRTPIAIRLQRWARSVLSEKIIKQQRELDFFWDREDKKDLY